MYPAGSVYSPENEQVNGNVLSGVLVQVRLKTVEAGLEEFRELPPEHRRERSQPRLECCCKAVGEQCAVSVGFERDELDNGVSHRYVRIEARESPSAREVPLDDAMIHLEEIDMDPTRRTDTMRGLRRYSRSIA